MTFKMSKTAKKIVIMFLFTALFLFVFRFGTWVTLPFVNANMTNQLQIGFLNTVTGGALGRFSILCLGISPYITSSIVVQLLQMDILPVLKEWGEEGEEGKQKLNQLTRYISLGLAFVQALTLTIGINANYSGFYFEAGAGDIATPVLYIYTALIATAGTAFALWLAEMISQFGIGNGTSMLICAGILAEFPSTIGELVEKYIKSADTKNIFFFILILVILLLVVLFIVFMEGAQRKIPIQYANRPSQAMFRGQQDSNIPIKLNSASVIPVIFASTLMSLPTTIISILNLNTTSGAGYWLNQIFSTTSVTDGDVTINVIGFSVYLILIFLFSFFYSFLQLNPENMSSNLQKQNAYIPGVRPGEETTSYISRVLFKITMVGATYLAIVAIIPVILSSVFDIYGLNIGGTSLIIVVGVAIETASQLKTQIQNKEYRGFME